jgi:general secretion pathway protein J
MTAVRARSRGFTLVELIIALLLLACMSAVMFGSLSLASRSWDSGEAKSHQVSDMRSTQTYLRAQISAQYPQRLWKMAGLPLLFAGGTDEIRYAAALPARVAEGGVYFFRVALVKEGDKSQLVQQRMIPDTMALQEPEFSDAQRSVLADAIAELRITYFGRDPDAAETEAPTWRDHWDDKQQLPLLVRIDVKPEKGSAWPTLLIEPRRSLEAGCPAWDPSQKRCTRTL